MGNYGAMMIDPWKLMNRSCHGYYGKYLAQIRTDTGSYYLSIMDTTADTCDSPTTSSCGGVKILPQLKELTKFILDELRLEQLTN